MSESFPDAKSSEFTLLFRLPRSKQDAASERWASVPSIALALLMLSLVAGCRGRAQRDLYTQKLQQEVRVLEDQLYEADYENDVLIQKLRRLQEQRTSVSRPSTRAPREPQSSHESFPSLAAPIQAPIRDSAPHEDDQKFDMEHGFEEVPPGDVFTPRKTTLPPPRTTPKKTEPKETPESALEIPDLDSLIDPGQLVDPGELVDPGKLQSPPMLEPAPSQPEPPGPSDMKVDPIEPGDVLPPNSIDGSPDGPPGKITLPPGLGMLGNLGPVAGASPQIVRQTRAIEIDVDATVPLLASGAKTGSESLTTLGIDLAIRSRDQFGHPIAILSETINPINRLAGAAAPPMRPVDDPAKPTSLNVLVLDPKLTGEEAKLGRWDFTPDMIASLRRQSTDPASIKFPIRWQEKKPSGDAVIVFVQFREADQDIRCEAEIPFNKTPSVAGWLPRH